MNKRNIRSLIKTLECFISIYRARYYGLVRELELLEQELKYKIKAIHKAITPENTNLKSVDKQ